MSFPSRKLQPEGPLLTCKFQCMNLTWPSNNETVLKPSSSKPAQVTAMTLKIARIPSLSTTCK